MDRDRATGTLDRDAAGPPAERGGLLTDAPPAGTWLPLDWHRALYRQPPRPGRAPWATVVEAIDRSGLSGRGGAGFPTGRKLAALVAAPGPRVVVANGAEGEPASRKDHLLLTRVPHLVLDGALLAAAAVAADRVMLCIDRADADAIAAVRRALAERSGERSIAVEVVATPSRYVAGESSALVRWINGGPAKPSGHHAHVAGVGGAPTLVQNVETLAHLAQIVRFGPAWFRQAGTASEPGTSLVTVSGAVGRPVVTEVALGTSLAEIVDRAGGPAGRPVALLVGGFAGTWVLAQQGMQAPFSRAGLAPYGASPGAGVVAVLPEGACGLSETARVLSWFAAEGAGQCGPCVFGLPALAATAADLARGQAGPTEVARLRRWADEIVGRGACGHPDGAVAILRSALDVFADDVARHAAGRPCGPDAQRPVLPVPASTSAWR